MPLIVPLPKGLDIRDIELVIQYGLLHGVPSALQRGGRGGHDFAQESMFLIMYESWALTVNLADVPAMPPDPDQPLDTLTKYSTKLAQSSVAVLRIIQSTDCLRKSFADYLADKLPDGQPDIYGSC